MMKKRIDNDDFFHQHEETPSIMNFLCLSNEGR